MVEEAVKNCIPCQASYSGPSRCVPIQSTPLPPGPWSEVAIDFSGPFPSGDYFLLVLDEYSRYPEIEVGTSTSAKTAIPRLQSIFSRQGYPTVVKCDNGPPFQGQDFADFASMCGFKHRRITPLWPEANGAVERFMAVINKFVRSMISESRNLKSELASFLLHDRATPHSSTKVSTFEATTGRKMNIGIPKVIKRVSTRINISSKMINLQAKQK